MTQEMLNKWLEAYNELEKEYNRLWDKMEKHEREGKMELARKNAYQMDLIAERQEGMIVALEIFGYTAQYQNGQCVIVVNA